MPKKDSKQPTRQSKRIQNEQQNNKNKKKPNLKDILSQKSSSQKRKSGIEQDGDFVFKRTASQLGEASSSIDNGSTITSTNTASNRSKPSQKATMASQSKKVRKLTAEDVSITPEINRTHDYEEHSTSVQVALPISDTPIIRRNKDLRNATNGRRSSLNRRGKRVSSIGNGYSAVPHDKVPASQFYKHLDSDLPDPHKMRQLLSWCSKRKFEEDKNKHIKQKNKLSHDELTALNIAKHIKEEIVKDLVDGKINISWWNKDDDENDPQEKVEKVLVPNERNIQNAKVLQELKDRLEYLNSQTREWELRKLAKQIELPVIETDKVTTQKVDDTFKRVLDNSIIKEISEIEDSTYNEISNNLEFQLDFFNDLVNKMKSSSSVTSRYNSLQSKKLTEILDTSFDDNTIHKIQENEKNQLSTEQLLKGISRLDQ